jgi:hypothetical protein
MDSDELASAGRALYGERWQTSLATDLRVADRTVRRWLASETTIPDGVERELRDVLIKRATELGSLIGFEVRSADRSVLHHPTNAIFQYDDLDNVTVAHRGFASWDSLARLVDSAKEAVRKERSRDEELARRFIRESAWWLTHFHKPVPAPKHADRMYMSQHGWAVDFGANSFLVEKAIERCRKELERQQARADAGEVVPRSEIKEELEKVISGCVANSNGQEYSGYYPIRRSDRTLVFGAQGIGVDDGANLMISDANLRWDGDALARPGPSHPQASPELSIEQLPFNSVLLRRVDMLELSVRTSRCLKDAPIIHIGDLVQKTEAEMLRMPNFGRNSLNEIKKVLASAGLHLGMEVLGWPPENIEQLATAYELQVN